MYAAISADQAANLAPPDFPSPFLISNSPRREKAAQRLQTPLQQQEGEKKKSSKTLVFYYTTSKLGYQA